MTTIKMTQPQLYTCYESLYQILGPHQIKTSRYWYKGHQNCDVVVVREGEHGIVAQASGSVRFRMNLSASKKGILQGRLTVYGWLSEVPHALSLVTQILQQMAKEIEQHRQKKAILEIKAREMGEEIPDFVEPIGMVFSVKGEEAKLKDKDKIDEVQSTLNFEQALRMKWYHQDFVNFCREHEVKCYFRPLQELERHEPLERSS